MVIKYNIQCPFYKKIIGVIQINSSKGIPHTDPTLVDLRFKCKRCKKYHWVKAKTEKQIQNDRIVANASIMLNDIMRKMAQIDQLGDKKK